MRWTILPKMGAAAGLLATTALAELPTMKMTTPIPPGIETPDTIETPICTRNLVDGVPTEETTQKVHDNLDLIRATEAYLNSIQIASMEGLREGILTFGPANTTVLVFQDLLDSKALRLTGNTTSVYFAAWMNLGDEPMVIETPPNVLGIVHDHWFLDVTDLGNAGTDKGQGGKYLIVPPGFEGDLPADGYHVVRTNTFGNWVMWRGFQVVDDSQPAVAATKDSFRMYPLSQAGSPPDMTFVDISGLDVQPEHRVHLRLGSGSLDGAGQRTGQQGGEARIAAGQCRRRGALLGREPRLRTRRGGWPPDPDILVSPMNFVVPGTTTRRERVT